MKTIQFLFCALLLLILGSCSENWIDLPDNIFFSRDGDEKSFFSKDIHLYNISLFEIDQYGEIIRDDKDCESIYQDSIKVIRNSWIEVTTKKDSMFFKVKPLPDNISHRKIMLNIEKYNCPRESLEKNIEIIQGS